MDNQYILIDTSIIIDHLRKQNKKNSILYNTIDKYQFHTSTIVEFEVFLGATDMQKFHDVKDILQLC